jgi:hypothetical protein
MTLESAERLVEKILQQLQVKYEVSGDSPAHHDHHHDGDDHPEEKQRSIVVDAEAVPKLPVELHPFVSTRGEPEE